MSFFKIRLGKLYHITGVNNLRSLLKNRDLESIELNTGGFSSVDSTILSFGDDFDLFSVML